MKHDLEVAGEQIKADLEKIEQQKRALAVKERKIDEMAQRVRENSAEIESFVAVSHCCCQCHIVVQIITGMN